MSKKVRFTLGSFLLLAVVTGFLGCGGDSIANAQEKKKEEEAIPVEVTTVVKGDISAYFTGTASLEAEGEAKVVAKVGGVVKDILVEEGDRVKAGQVLAQLDDEKLVLDLAEARARLMQLESEFKRNQQLHQKRIVSTEVFERVKSDFEMQKAKVGMAKLMKDYASIRAPIGGVVAERMIKKGNMLTQHEACFKITDFDPLLAVLHVPEKEMSKLKKEQTAVLSVDALPNAEFSGRIERISPVVDAGTGTFKVTVTVTDKKRTLKPGMFSRVRIVYDRHIDTLLLPKDAVLIEGNESVVFVVSDQKVQRKIVEIGYINTTHMEIKSGLKAGDTVVQTGIGGLKDGSKVEVLTPAGGSS